MESAGAERRLPLSAESVFHAEVGDTVAALLRAWVGAKAGVGGRFSLFRDDKRAARTTLEQLERALGMMGGSGSFGRGVDCVRAIATPSAGMSCSVADGTGTSNARY